MPKEIKGNTILPLMSTKCTSFLSCCYWQAITNCLGENMYWENSSNVLNTALSNAMSRNCFEELLSVSHLSNNMKLDTSDKLAKVRSFYNLIVCPCVEFRKWFSSWIRAAILREKQQQTANPKQSRKFFFFFYNNDFHKNKSTYNSAPTIFCVAGEK